MTTALLQTLSRYWRLEKIAYKSRRFIIMMLLMVVAWGLAGFTIAALLATQLVETKAEFITPDTGQGLADALIEMPIIGIAMVVFFVEQANYWQQGIYRRFMIDGFQREDIVFYQWFSLSLRYVVNVVLCLVMGLLVIFAMNGWENTMLVFSHIRSLSILFLFAKMIYMGAVAILLINLIRKLTAVLVYFGLMIAESTITSVFQDVGTYLPLRVGGYIDSLVERTALSTEQLLLVVGYAIILFAGIVAVHRKAAI